MASSPDWYQQYLSHRHEPTSSHAHDESRLPQVPFVGRDSELVALMDAYTVAEIGTGQCLVLVGASGIGKTRLVDEFLRVLVDRQPRPQVLRGCHLPNSLGGSGDAILGALRGHFGAEGFESSIRTYLQGSEPLAEQFGPACLSDRRSGGGGQPYGRSIQYRLRANPPGTVAVNELSSWCWKIWTAVVSWVCISSLALSSALARFPVLLIGSLSGPSEVSGSRLLLACPQCT